MIDFHSHILPGVDDGSSGVEESLRLLTMQAEQGISTVVATPHFYAEEMSPDSFLERRAKAAETLKESLNPDLPQIALGAEVYFFRGISRAEELDKLKIVGTDLLLLEMPFATWSDGVIGEVLDLAARNDLQIILAHIERYLAFQKKDVWPMLRSNGIRMQVNASFFLEAKRRLAVRMLKKDEVHLIGSDCHNIKYRPPRLREAFEYIRKKKGQDALMQVEALGNLLLETAEVIGHA